MRVSVKKHHSLKLAFVFGGVFSFLPDTVFAQIADQPAGDEERPLTSVSTQEEAESGNIFHRKPGQPHSYWDNLVGHLSVEAGITGNPWTRSGRNFAQFYSDRANTVTLNQILGSLSHPVEDVGHGYGVGFVFESLYGSDARFDPTAGMASGAINGLYQWIPTQAHIDFKMPWIFKNGIDLQIGQQYGLLGSEGTPAQARPFYTFNYASVLIFTEN